MLLYVIGGKMEEKISEKIAKIQNMQREIWLLKGEIELLEKLFNKTF